MVAGNEERSNLRLRKELIHCSQGGPMGGKGEPGNLKGKGGGMTALAIWG